MLRARAVVLASALILAPLGARAADLVVWWNKGFYYERSSGVKKGIKKNRFKLSHVEGRAATLRTNGFAVTP